MVHAVCACLGMYPLTYLQQFFVEGMLTTLAPLHDMLDEGPDTLREVSFQQAFGRDLREAHDWCGRRASVCVRLRCCMCVSCVRRGGVDRGPVRRDVLTYMW